MLLNALSTLLLLCTGTWQSAQGKKVKITTTAAPLSTRKVCHQHGDLDQIFTRTFSVISMQSYCEMLDSFSDILRNTNRMWPRVSTPDGSCYDKSNWKFEPANYSYVLKAVFRHHIDIDKDNRMSQSEKARYLMPALRYHLLPGLLLSEYRHLQATYFGRSVGSIGEDAFVGTMTRMMRSEWAMLVRRTLPDLDGDNCITRIEFASAVCRKQINDIDLYFRLADLDNNRAVTSPEFEMFKSITPVEPGEEPGAQSFFDFYKAVTNMIAQYSADYYQLTSYAHDDMITFNEVNLYICLYVI